MKHETLPFIPGHSRSMNEADRWSIVSIKHWAGARAGHRDNRPAVSAGGAPQRRRGRRPQF